jgi:putative membrane protein
MDHGQFWGMHFVWWIIWVSMIIWIFATPYDIPGQRKKKDTPLDILKRRFANGEIRKEEYEEKKQMLEQ